MSYFWIRIMQLLLQGVDVCLSLSEIDQCRLITYETIKAPPIIGTVVSVSLIEPDSWYTVQIHSKFRAKLGEKRIMTSIDMREIKPNNLDKKLPFKELYYLDSFLYNHWSLKRCNLIFCFSFVFFVVVEFFVVSSSCVILQS